MDEAGQRYAQWKAPKEDGALLLWPEPVDLLNQARSNHASLRRSNKLILGQPLGSLRRQMRQFLGHHDDDRLLFVAGHQSELHHPGVWVKNVLIDATARRTDGVALHVAVDTDAPKHLSIRAPDFSEPFTDDRASTSADWSQLLAPPTPAHLDRLQSGLANAAAAWPFVPSVGGFLEASRRQLMEAENLPQLLTASLHAFDWSLGLRYSALLASPIWQSAPYLALAYHLLANADRFAADFNAELNEYRNRHGIRTPGRPMPDLAVRPDRIETPFWRDDLNRRLRVRAWVERVDNKWALVMGGRAGTQADALPLDPAMPADRAVDALSVFLRRHALRLSPRALTLTMTLRLLAADQFMHGIGGGQYDQVTDGVIARHFKLDPPRFVVTTATLYWPVAAGKRRTDLPALLHQGHVLKHAALGDKKQGYLEMIGQAPRRSLDRAKAFHQMHDALTAAIGTSPAVHAWETNLEQARENALAERAIFDRELFYGLQPAERLHGLIGQYEKRFIGI